MSSKITESTALLSDNPYQNATQNQTDKKNDQSSNSNNTGKTTGTGEIKNTSSINKKVVAKPLGPNMAPQRTSRITQKLKLLPDALDYESNEDDEFNEDDSKIDGDNMNNNSENLKKKATTALKQYSLQKIKDRNARKDAERLGKKHRSMLPRVTAYCTAGSYKMRDFIRWLKDKKRFHSTNPKLFDECIYTPFTYKKWNNRRDSSSSRKSEESIEMSNNNNKNDLMNNNSNNSSNSNNNKKKQLIQLDDEGGIIDVGKNSTDLFIFEYGVIVMWGFSKHEERMFLMELAKFENEKLADEDVQKEEFNYYITQSYQPRIYNDFFTLRDDKNHMLKLSISYAISQSVKISLFEELVDNTIEDTQDIPKQISQTGKVEMSREEIMKSIGELFILRININLHGSILDSPELMWSEPELEPIYQATRGYLEINQRVALLNQRLEIISDLLQMLKEQLGHNNDEQLELIIILLIGAEVLVSLINIVVDIYSRK